MHPQPPANHNLELQREIDTLHQRLRQLHADAEHNQRVLARFQSRELELLGAGQLTELLGRLTNGMRRSFGVDAIRLLLLDPFLVIRDLLAGTPDMPEDALRDIELCTDIAATRDRFVDLHAPWLGPWDGGGNPGTRSWSPSSTTRPTSVRSPWRIFSRSMCM